MQNKFGAKSNGKSKYRNQNRTQFNSMRIDHVMISVPNYQETLQEYLDTWIPVMQNFSYWEIKLENNLNI